MLKNEAKDAFKEELERETKGGDFMSFEKIDEGISLKIEIFSVLEGGMK